MKNLEKPERPPTQKIQQGVSLCMFYLFVIALLCVSVSEYIDKALGYLRS